MTAKHQLSPEVKKLLNKVADAHLERRKALIALSNLQPINGFVAIPEEVWKKIKLSA